jgi:hypothetical protein
MNTENAKPVDFALNAAVKVLERYAKPHRDAVEAGAVSICAKAIAIAARMGLSYSVNIFAKHNLGTVMLSLTAGTEYALVGIPLTGVGSMRLPMEPTQQDTAYDVLTSIATNSDFQEYVAQVVDSLVPHWAPLFHYESAVEALLNEVPKPQVEIKAVEQKLTPVMGSGSLHQHEAYHNPNARLHVKRNIARKIGEYMLEQGLLVESDDKHGPNQQIAIELIGTVVVPLKE